MGFIYRHYQLFHRRAIVEQGLSHDHLLYNLGGWIKGEDLA